MAFSILKSQWPSIFTIQNSVYRALYGEVVPLDTLSLSSHHH